MASPLPFVPRQTFAVSASITRPYFLGHHASALASMRRILSGIGLVIECRDARVPFASRNPLLETALLLARDSSSGSSSSSTETPRGGDVGAGGSSRMLQELSAQAAGEAATRRRAGTGRIVVYTKADLVPPNALAALAELQRRRNAQDHHRRWRRPGGNDDEEVAVAVAGSDCWLEDEVVFTDSRSDRSVRRLVEAVRRRARLHRDRSVLGLRALVVGMPNAGKSSLLNALRRVGIGEETGRDMLSSSGGGGGGGEGGRRKIPKAARTGAEPGVTRKIGTPVRILAASDGAGGKGGGEGEGGATDSEAVYLLDTPGVFVPHISSPETLLRLALAGLVKDGLVPWGVLADYLLFRLNLESPSLYSPSLAPRPTNDVAEFLEAVAVRTGRLGKGGVPATESAAMWVVQQWRAGRLGRFVLEDASREAVARREEERMAGTAPPEMPVSLNQAKKRERAARSEKARARHRARKGAGGD